MVGGCNFVAGSVGNWNGSALSTTFVSKGQLQAVVPATNLASAATAAITVSNPGPGGGTSDAAYFPVGPPNPKFIFSKAHQNFLFCWQSLVLGHLNPPLKMD